MTSYYEDFGKILILSLSTGTRPKTTARTWRAQTPTKVVIFLAAQRLTLEVAGTPNFTFQLSVGGTVFDNRQAQP